jgi:hypothetical protein
MATFTYEFEELPLVIANGIPAGQINGCAELTFVRDGNWQVQSVCVEGYQTLTQEERSAGKKPWVYITAPDDIAAIVEERLSKEWSFRVQDAIREAIEAEREADAEFRADMRREDRYAGAW